MQTAIANQSILLQQPFLEDLACPTPTSIPLEKIMHDLPIGIAIIPIRESELRYSNDTLISFLNLQRPPENFRELVEVLSPQLDLSALVIKSIDEDAPLTCKPFIVKDRWLQITVNPSAHNTSYCLLTVEDVSESHGRELAKNEFFSLLSHELRTPLIAIAGCGKLIRDYYQGNYPDQLLDDMSDEIIRTGDHLLAMVNDFLNMDRLESGRFSYEIAEFRPYDIANELLHDLTPLAIERNLNLKLWPDRPLAATMQSDGQRVKQILTNLCGNALKFTQTGEVGISIEEGRDEITFRVYDTGQGIEQTDRQLIFEKYRQAKNPFLVDPNRSSGLGLYISKLMANGLGGDIQLEWSEVGKGSTFLLRLPYTAKVKE